MISSILTLLAFKETLTLESFLSFFIKELKGEVIFCKLLSFSLCSLLGTNGDFNLYDNKASQLISLKKT